MKIKEVGRVEWYNYDLLLEEAEEELLELEGNLVIPRTNKVKRVRSNRIRKMKVEIIRIKREIQRMN